MTRTPTVRARVRRALAAAALIPTMAVAGCFTADAGLSISGSDRVNGTIHVTAPRDASMRQSMWEAPEDLGTDVSVSLDDSGTERRATYSVSDLTFDELRDVVAASTIGDAIDLDLERTGGDQVSVSGKATLSRYPGSKITLAIAFPSPVTGTNGTVDGSDTVRWTLDGGRDTTFWATAPAGSTDRDQLLMWSAIVAVAGILASLLVFLWARRDHDMRD